MAEKHEIVSYLIGLMDIMNAKQALGNAPGDTLVREYIECYGRLTGILRDEHSSADKKEKPNE